MLQAGDHRPIQAQTFQPSDTRQGVGRLQLWQGALTAIVLTTTAALWFLFTAKSVVVSFSPTADEWAVSGGLSLQLGNVVLLREGTYTVSAVTTDHKPLSEPLQVSAANSQNIQFNFVPTAGTLVLSRQPTDAQIYVDGSKLDIAPAASSQLQLEAGRRNLELRHPRYLSLSEQVEIEGKGVTQSLNVELAPAWSDVTVRSEPSGAEIWVDGQNTDLTTPTRVQIMQGERAVRVQKPGFKAFRRRVLAVAGVAQDLDAGVLVRADAQVTISSTPANAAVTINGIYLGQTPLQLDVQSNVPQQLQLLHPGYAPGARSLLLAQGDTKEIAVTLERLLGEVRIKTRPTNALVTVNNKAVEPQNTTLRLPLEPQNVSVTLPGYAGFDTVLTPRAGLVQELKVQLLTLEEARLAALVPVVQTPQGHTLRLFNADVVNMGASRREPGRRANETIRRAEFTRLFYLAEREVTNAQFRAFASGHDSGSFQEQSLDGDDQPVANVSWHDAAAYCNWLSDQEGYEPFYTIEFAKVIGTNPTATGYRLPTEAEWAWVARRRPSSDRTTTLSDQLKFAWGNALPPPERFANYADRAAGNLVGRVIFGYNDNYGVSAPVGTFRANAHGLYDLDGNVAEWTHDWYEIPQQTAVTDHRGPATGEYRVMRGASWMHGTITELRLSFRDYGIEGRNDVGFRVARYAE